MRAPSAVALCAMACVAAVSAENARFPSVYEISTRPWLYALSQASGAPVKLADVPKSEFQRIADLGFDVVWLMGVWSLGPYGLHHDQTDPGLLSNYAKELPGYTQADIIGAHPRAPRGGRPSAAVFGRRS